MNFVDRINDANVFRIAESSELFSVVKMALKDRDKDGFFLSTFERALEICKFCANMSLFYIDGTFYLLLWDRFKSEEMKKLQTTSAELKQTRLYEQSDSISSEEFISVLDKAESISFCHGFGIASFALDLRSKYSIKLYKYN